MTEEGTPAMSDDPTTPQAAPAARKYVENKPPRGVYVRVFIYVVATHALLAFMSLIFIIAKNR
ncbi:hypothetical protein ADK78_03580 [Kitasatospora aureofaciens]|nr:hypothetical protein ADK76_30195 [Streptomyces griseoflavus]KOG81508.1 hypothetical protein ADK78_03580 [Kitasatospora aureofaciens]KUJ33422.1 hypothetical protein ADK46_19650 [Streptomyces rimosus subsp. rimosus]KWT60645.1 hypothetical protein ADL21_17240 [Streptomyces albus subsp. albus]